MLSWIATIFRSVFRARSQDPVDKLDIPAESKRFVAALPVPDDPSCMLYLVTVQVLSERSVRDVENIVAAVRPHAVIAAVQSHLMLEFLEEEQIVRDLDGGFTVPDSFLTSFMHSSAYTIESAAAFDFQRIIFGTTYHGYALAAKRAACQAGSSFSLLHLFLTIPEEQHHKVKSGGIHWSFSHELQLYRSGSTEFAASFFPVFLMLDQLNSAIGPAHRTHDSNALAAAERIVHDVAAGADVSGELLDSVRKFRVTLEYFRLLQDYVARRSAMTWSRPPPFSLSTFEELPEQAKLDILLAQALQEQARKSKVVVAAIDGSQSLGVRKYWNVRVPPEVAAMSSCFEFSSEDSSAADPESRDNMLALGAGAAAIAGATKFLSSKAPAFAKLPWTLSTARSSYVRAFMALAKRRSLGAVHWSFYGLMRERSGMPSLKRPWVVFGASVLTTLGLFCAEDQIGAAVEAVPQALSVARLGRGLEKLKRTAAETKTETALDDLYDLVHQQHISARANLDFTI